jgi:hypothetical protein
MARPLRPRIIRIIPDPRWGARVVGATPDQLRRFDERVAVDREVSRKAQWVGLAVAPAGVVVAWAGSGSPPITALGLVLLLMGSVFAAAGAMARRAPVLRKRNWGVYEEGILCLYDEYRNQPSFSRWDDIRDVRVRYEWAAWAREEQRTAWTIWVRGKRGRVGAIPETHLSYSYGMDRRQREAARDAVLAEAVRRLGRERVTAVATWGARRNMRGAKG